MHILSVLSVLSLFAIENRVYASTPLTEGNGLLQARNLESKISRQIIRVLPGQSIQAALDRSQPYTTIIVSAGTYFEQLSLTKNGTSLIGHGAILMPPAVAISNECSGNFGLDTQGMVRQAGICIIGQNLSLAPFVSEHKKVVNAGQPVQDVTVSGLKVSNFTGANIAMYGGANVQVRENTLTESVWYGILSAGSKDTKIVENTVTSSTSEGFIDICVDDLGGAEVNRNVLSDNYFGLCVSTPGAEIKGNNVSKTCVGAFVDPGVSGARIHDNRFELLQAPGYCAGLFGVWLGGATDTVVRRNFITGYQGGDGIVAAGILVADDLGSMAEGNVVKHNTLSGNGLDIWNNSTGSGNVFWRNDCSVSLPAGLCGRT